MKLLTGTLVAVAFFCLGSQSTQAQVVYYPAPVTTYYVPAPATIYSAPAPITYYYAPTPVSYYYAPPVTYYRPLIGGTVSGWRYNSPATVYVYR